MCCLLNGLPSSFIFQSTLPHGERHMYCIDATFLLLFQSTLPHGERQTLQQPRRVLERFNPRSHMGSDGWCRSFFTHNPKFQSTLPHGERPCSLSLGARGGSFNPRSHMGSDIIAHTRLALLWNVSIHAPTWGATHWPSRLHPLQLFQSTRPHGERRNARRDWTRISGFNPRSHMGSDLIIKCKFSPFEVSIHAPTWGATQGWLCCHSSIWFQSTLPHGERLEHPQRI